MKKAELIGSLKSNYSSFVNYVESLPKEAFDYHQYGKWFAGLQTAHLEMTAKPFYVVQSSFFQNFC